MDAAERQRLRRCKVLELGCAQVLGIALGRPRVGLERPDAGGRAQQPGQIDSDLREGILLKGRDDVPMVVVVRPRPAIITVTRVVQATDRVRRVTDSSRHRAAGDDYVLAAVPLKDPEGTEVAALREVHGDQDISGGLQSKKTARL